MAIPSPWPSAKGMAGQTVKEFPQYIQRSSLTTTALTSLSGCRRIAPVGQEAITVGISQVAANFSLSTFGIFVWTPTIAKSEQWTAPHMLMQHANETLSLAGSFMLVK